LPAFFSRAPDLFTPAGRWFGFEAPPLGMLGAVAFLVVLYLVCAELLKRVVVVPSATSKILSQSVFKS
jgi:Mg2+-importing ATPase